MKKVVWVLLLFSHAGWAYAEHPVDVQRAEASAEYLTALELYKTIPQRRRTLEATLAAARSAWALSLPTQAKELFDLALRDNRITKIERTRVYFSKGIIEYQDEDYAEALLFANKALEGLTEASELRSQVNLLSAEAYTKLGKLAQAEQKYQMAIEEAGMNDRAELNFLLAEARMHLGKNEESAKNFMAIPIDAPRGAAAITGLAQIEIQKGNFTNAVEWLEKGRAEFPESFLDSNSGYNLMKAYLGAGNLEAAQQLEESSRQKFAPSDGGVVLMQALLEASLWQNEIKAKEGQ